MEKPDKIIFELKIDDASMSGVYAISLVTAPAIEQNFVAFSSQKPVQLSINADKRIVTGPVLIPNQYIYRKDERGEYYVYMSDETIFKIREKFHKGTFVFNTTHQHQLPLFGNSVIESWIIEDSAIDKSVLYGYSDLPVGTWMVSIKIEDEKYWNEYVKTGIVKGFSIEGVFSEYAVMQSADVKNISFMITTNTEYNLIDGGIIIVNDDYTVTSNGILLEDGEYELEDGTYFEIYDSYLVAVYPPVYDEVMVDTPDNGLFAKVKQLFGFFSPSKKKKVKKRKINKKSLAQIIKDLIDLQMSKTNLNKQVKFADLTTVDGIVVTVDDTTNRVDVVDADGMVIGYLEFVPAEQAPAPDSTAQSEQTSVSDTQSVEMKKAMELLEAKIEKLTSQTIELTAIINNSVPNKVQNDKRDFAGQTDSLNSFLKQRTSK